MNSDKVFQIALLVSVVVHTGIFLQNSNFSLFSKTPKENKIEVSYVKQEPLKQDVSKQISLKREPFLSIPDKISADKRTPPPIPPKDASAKISKDMLPVSPGFGKPALIKPDLIAIKKKISLPPIDMDKNKINNPSYISYYQLVREKIRRLAYQNYTRTETGEVYLSFVISRDGSLEEARMVQERSSPNTYLQDTALKSIKEASPFPAFPKELEYPRLSFNVVISFEVE
jgi:TonB family protein